jgi:hypothetical protein
MDLNRIKNLVSQDENVLFHGCFNEKTIRADLSFRREKKNFYIESYNKLIDDHRTISNALQIQDDALKERSRKCQKEASRLLDIVYEY